MKNIMKNLVIILSFLLFCSLPSIAEPLFEYQPENSVEKQPKRTVGIQIGGGVIINKPMLQFRAYGKIDNDWELFLLHNNGMPFRQLSNFLWFDFIIGGKYYISDEGNFRQYIDVGIGGGFLGVYGTGPSSDAMSFFTPSLIFETGFDYMFNDNFGIYFDVNTGLPSLIGANVGIRF